MAKVTDIVDLPHRLSHLDGWILLDRLTEEPIQASFSAARDDVRAYRRANNLKGAKLAKCRRILAWHIPKEIL